MDGQLPLALSVGGATFLLGVIWGGPFVAILHRLKLGKQIRAELMDSHHVHKIGTPTMGGIMIILPTIAITIALNISRIVEEGSGRSILLPLLVLIGFALLGFIDDWEGIQTSRGSVGEGLSGTIKFAAQILLALAASTVISHFEFSYANSLTLPLVGIEIPMHPVLFVGVSTFIIVATSNATNFTDGLDGLAGIISASAFGAYGIIAFLQNQIFMVELCFVIVGACFAFLWYNAHPAQLFMGDTGSLALGATLGTVRGHEWRMAALTRHRHSPSNGDPQCHSASRLRQAEPTLLRCRYSAFPAHPYPPSFRTRWLERNANRAAFLADRNPERICGRRLCPTLDKPASKSARSPNFRILHNWLSLSQPRTTDAL